MTLLLLDQSFGKEKAYDIRYNVINSVMALAALWSSLVT